MGVPMGGLVRHHCSDHFICCCCCAVGICGNNLDFRSTTCIQGNTNPSTTIWGGNFIDDALIPLWIKTPPLHILSFLTILSFKCAFITHKIPLCKYLKFLSSFPLIHSSCISGTHQLELHDAYTVPQHLRGELEYAVEGLDSIRSVGWHRDLHSKELLDQLHLLRTPLVSMIRQRLQLENEGVAWAGLYQQLAVHSLRLELYAAWLNTTHCLHLLIMFVLLCG